MYRYVGNEPTTRTDPSGLVEENGWFDIHGTTEMNGYVVPSNFGGWVLSIPGAYAYWPLTGTGDRVKPRTGTPMSSFAGSQLRQKSHYGIVEEGGNFEGRICPSQPVPPSEQMTIRVMAEGYYTFLSSGGDMVLAVTPIVVVPKWRIYSASEDAVRFGCDDVADQIMNVMGRGSKQQIRPMGRERLPNGGWLPRAKAPGDAAYSTFNWGHHTVVVDNGRVYDALTGFKGLPIDEYKQLWEFPDQIDWPF